jgi:methionyl aminopeptidase
MMGIQIKTTKEIETMAEGGRRLAEVREKLKDAVKIGESAAYIDELAEKLIKKLGGEPSFKKVANYFWTTCININEGVVHGIPHKELIFKKGDLVSVDVGIFYKGFHTDTSFSIGLGTGKAVDKILQVGKDSLANAISKAKPGGRVFDISNAMENTLKKAKLNPIKALVGHGVGRSLHEDPQIPCFVHDKRDNTPILVEGMVLAIEVMYTPGNGEIIKEEDGWTISTQDGKISALFEETVAITKRGPRILTKSNHRLPVEGYGSVQVALN